MGTTVLLLGIAAAAFLAGWFFSRWTSPADFELIEKMESEYQSLALEIDLHEKHIQEMDDAFADIAEY